MSQFLKLRYLYPTLLTSLNPFSKWFPYMIQCYCWQSRNKILLLFIDVLLFSRYFYNTVKLFLIFVLLLKFSFSEKATNIWSYFKFLWPSQKSWTLILCSLALLVPWPGIDKVQLFWEDHKISQLSSNSFDKSADLLSKYQNKWKITPNFCGPLRKAELYKHILLLPVEFTTKYFLKYLTPEIMVIYYWKYSFLYCSYTFSCNLNSKLP